jgi:glycosyltransferase involved in cell wall biosynthesis
VRVLSVSALLDPVLGGGTAERTVQLARAMSRGGLQVEVLATDAGLDAGKPMPRLGGVAVNLLPCRSRRFLIPRAGPGQLDRLVAGTDIVHLCNHWTVLNLMVAQAARRQGKPYVVCPAGALPLFGRSQWLKRAYNALGGRALVANAAAWIAITRREADDFREYGIDPARVDVVPNGIDPDEYAGGDAAAFRRRLGLGDRRIVLFVGRLNAIKGPDLLLQAFRREADALADCSLVMVGPDGGMRASLEAQARVLGPGRVVFTGWLGGRDKVDAYSAADLVVIPSRQEAMSLVALEAGACGKPVLMTDRCGFDAAVSCGGARAVPPQADALARALSTMMASGQLAAMGAALRAQVLTQYTWNAAVERYRAIFGRILA